jgi:hypothetical protein
MSSRKASAATPPGPLQPIQAPSTAAYVGAAASSIPSSQQQQRIISAGGASANTVLAGSGNPSRSHTAPPSMSQAHHLLSLSTPSRPPFSLTARATSRPTAICSLPTHRPALTRSPWCRNAPPPPSPPILIPLLPLRCPGPPRPPPSFLFQF